jgi:hypothetical protein
MKTKAKNPKIKKKKVTRTQERKKLDRLWSMAVRAKTDNQCIICGETERTNAHHLIPRQVLKYRWNTSNGVPLCPKHHLFGIDISAHKSPYYFFKFLEETQPEILNTYIKHMSDLSIEKNVDATEIEKKLVDEIENYKRKGKKC